MKSSFTLGQENRSSNSLYGYNTPRRRRNTGKNAFAPWNPFHGYSPRNSEIQYGSMSDIYEPSPSVPFLGTRGYVRNVTPKKMSTYPGRTKKSSRKKSKRSKKLRKKESLREKFVINNYQQASPQKNFYRHDDYWGYDSGYNSDRVVSPSKEVRKKKSVAVKKRSSRSSLFDPTYEEVSGNMAEYINVELMTLKKKRIREEKRKKIRSGVNNCLKSVARLFCCIKV